MDNTEMLNIVYLMLLRYEREKRFINICSIVVDSLLILLTLILSTICALMLGTVDLLTADDKMIILSRMLTCTIPILTVLCTFAGLLHFQHNKHSTVINLLQKCNIYLKIKSGNEFDANTFLVTIANLAKYHENPDVVVSAMNGYSDNSLNK